MNFILLKKNRIAILDIASIIISLIIAIFLPFKLFLFSYAFLGPLHYLTEINWLRDKNYFIKKKQKWHILFFLIIAITIAMYPIINLINPTRNNWVIYFSRYALYKIDILIIGTLLFSISLVIIKNSTKLVLIMVISFLLAALVSFVLPKHAFLLGLLIPTIVHVYFFTLLFVVNGAIKTKSIFNIISTVILILIPFILIVVDVNPNNFILSESTLKSFNGSNMKHVNYYIALFFEDIIDYNNFNSSAIGIKIQMFIAFSYTYHYLNWFFKTSIIGWEKSLSKKSAILILLIWAVSVSIYIYDFSTGFILLLLFSTLHVIMEFPLNIISFKYLLESFNKYLKIKK